MVYQHTAQSIANNFNMDVIVVGERELKKDLDTLYHQGLHNIRVVNFLGALRAFTVKTAAGRIYLFYSPAATETDLRRLFRRPIASYEAEELEIA